ncbi:MAG: hypothetical protein A2Z11_04420 [Candidatus Woykebacteria bacterium RBG_16_43_9]|uniref:Type II secretion system protein GspG C-terminal domain-containing protein n=1 Tax=Candidatus Woykebacteria bacterium RBG_16_43_9 TaxID=1802596 RepID=A0A1G1WDA1_9BACT|nr:MAG: hypothetical protein A2Z11_04420 [Candidatus Woykebacteria bacterium RBG_16_43_9]
MSERGSLLVGLMMAGVILSFTIIVVIYSLPRYSTDRNSVATNSAAGTSEDGVGGTPADLINQANSVKIQADLKSIQTQMIAYYAEQGVYPNSLEDLTSFMGTQATASKITYISCSDQSALLYHDSSGYPGFVFNHEEVTPSKGSPPPSCGT